MILIPLLGRMGGGKTTFCINLARQLRSQGYKVATIQRTKGYSDIGRYLLESPDHYQVPICAAESLAALSEWLPVSYDIAIFECGFAPSETIPENRWSFSGKWQGLFGAENTNELIPHQETDRRNNTVSTVVRTKVINPEPSALCIDINRNLHNIERLTSIEIEGKLQYPVSLSKRVITYGIYPPEFRQIFPNLMWYRFDAPAFIDRYKHQDSYDLAIIGYTRREEELAELRTITRSHPVISFHPPVFIEGLEKFPRGHTHPDLNAYYNNPWKSACMPVYPSLDFITLGDNLITIQGVTSPKILLEVGVLEV